jgi:hypothetical protein
MSPDEARAELLDAIFDMRALITNLDRIRQQLSTPHPTVNRTLIKVRDAYGDLASHLGVPLTTTPTE